MIKLISFRVDFDEFASSVHNVFLPLESEVQDLLPRIHAESLRTYDELDKACVGPVIRDGRFNEGYYRVSTQDPYRTFEALKSLARESSREEAFKVGCGGHSN